jgi:molecular chaperone DnaK
MTGQKHIVGIDLGTTYSVVARLDHTGRPVTVSNAEGDLTTPSAVLFDGSDVIVGKEALRALAVEPERVAYCAKRDLGFTRVHTTINGTSYPPEVIQACVLKKLKDDASEKLGTVEQAVITVPAYFDDVRRKATQDAGYMAGLEVVDIINEPTAAALAAGLERGFLSNDAESNGRQRILVYDLGGGTFDVTVMEIEGTHLRTLAIDGDVRLGGQDWDQRLVDYVAEQFARAHRFDPRHDRALAAKLWRECEEAKRSLSKRRKVTITCDFKGKNLPVEVSRELFDELTSDLLARTEFTVCEVVKAAGLTWSAIDRILLAGGSCRMPMVANLLHKLSGKQPDVVASPDEAVAHGAAIHAGLHVARRRGTSPAIAVQQVNAHSLGVVATNPRTGDEENAIIIPRNNPLPAKVKRIFKTQRERQQSVLVRIVEGESKLPGECSSVGQCVVRPLPPNLPAGTPVEVKFAYAANARLAVTIRVNGSDCTKHLQWKRENSLSQEKLEHWRRVICKT